MGVQAVMEKRIKILGFVASLNKGSYNKDLMSTAVELKPEGCNNKSF